VAISARQIGGAIACVAIGSLNRLDVKFPDVKFKARRAAIWPGREPGAVG
jgi:hypothetical protein